jgi:hypothetical protein
MSMKDWSTTAASNATIASNSGINWQEGQAPSTVNDSARAMMSDVRAWYEAAEWIDLGHAPTYASGTSFTVPGDKTAIYTVGRRVKVYNGTSTFYATISAVSFSTNTTVTVVNDGSALSGALSTVAVGIQNPTNDSEPRTHNGVHTFVNDATFNGLTIGRGAGAVATNTAVGAGAVGAAATGTYATAVGYNALNVLSSGNYNTAVGGNSLQVNTTGASNSAVGLGSLSANTTGSYNTAVGESALRFNTTASTNTAVGYQAGYSNSTGPQSVYIGSQAGYSDTGGYNTIVGYNAGYGKTTGDSSTLIGRYAGYASGNHQSQTFVGDSAGYSTTGANNTFIGINSGWSVSTGTKNTILGSYNGNYGGLDIRTASNYIVLSDGDGNPRMYHNGLTWIIPMVGTNDAISVRLGGAGTAYHCSTGGASFSPMYYSTSSGQAGYISCSGNTTSYVSGSDYRLKNNIRPLKNGLALTMQMKPSEWEWKADGKFGSGFIAHELAEVCPQAVNGEKDAINEDGSIKPQGVDTSFLVGILTAAIQELKAEFDAYKATHP